MKRVISLVLVAVVAATLGFVGGARFARDFNRDLAAADAAGDGVYTVGVLRLLRQGKTEDAIRMLEIQLDSLIIKEAFAPSSPIFGDNAKLMAWVAKYRSEHPRVDYASPEVASFIERRLSRYGGTPPAPLSRAIPPPSLNPDAAGSPEAGRR